MHPYQYLSFLIIILYMLIPLAIILTLMGVYNIMKQPASNHILRMTWVIILIFLPLFGFIYYLLIGVKQLKES